MANMRRKLRAAVKQYRKEDGIHVILSPKEWELIKEAVETYLKHHADDMMMFEYQMILDDMAEIELKRREDNE